MQETNLFLVFLVPLNEHGIRYMVTGSVASMIYGEPRMTHDIDLVLVLTAEAISEFIGLFPQDQFYCPPQEVILEEIEKTSNGHFNIIHHETGFKANIYPIGRDVLHDWAMSKRRKLQLGGAEMWIAPLEYVIIRKLQYYKEGRSEKHLRDIRRMLQLSSSTIDTKVLQQFISQYELSGEWEKVIQSGGDL